MKNSLIRADEGPITEQKFEDFERDFSLKLPTFMKIFLKENDQPRLYKNHFKFRNTFSETHGWPYRIDNGIDSRDLNFLAFNENSYRSENIFSAQDFDVYGHDHVVAFGIAANGDYICFDYRHDPKTNEPKIVVMFHDAYDDNRKMLICPVANTFSEFLDLLYKPED
jgi:hypothetical protein